MARDRPRNWPVVSSMGAGLTASLIAVLVILALRRWDGVVTIPDIISDTIITATPAPVFTLILDSLQHKAKPLLFASLMALQVIWGGALGLVYALVRQRVYHTTPKHLLGEYAQAVVASRLASGIAIAMLVWLVMLALVLPFTASGRRYQADSVVLSMLFTALAHGLALSALVPVPPALTEWLAAIRSSEDPDRSRRRFVALAAVGAVAVIGGSLAWALRPSRRAVGSRATLTPEITPNDQFYVVSKNFTDPLVPVTEWKLEITGLVERPFTLTYDEMLALPSVTQFVTLECISNQVGDTLMSNAEWRGVRLRDLLERAGVKSGVVDVVFRAWDDYHDSLPLAAALNEATLVAYEMNGEPLPASHGFPARIIVPGLYGEKHVKWLTRIELVDTDYKGFWQQQGWSDTAVIKTTSRFDIPKAGDRLPDEGIMIGGVAFAGRRGVRSVEVSDDDGATWRSATLKPPLSPFTWVLWLADWRPRQPGHHTLKVRATDGEGQVQIAEESRPFPDGATGLHSVRVEVVERPENTG